MGRHTSLFGKDAMRLNREASDPEPQGLPDRAEKSESSQLGTRWGRAALWSTAAAVALRGGPILCSIIIARMLGKEEFGALSIIHRTVIFFGSLAGMGLGLTATKYIAQHRWSNPLRAGKILTLILFASVSFSLLMSLTLYAFSSELAGPLLKADRLAPLVRLSCPILLLVTLSGILAGCLAGFEAFDTLAIIGAYDFTTSVTSTCLLTTLWGLEGALIALALTAMGTCTLSGVLLLYVCRHHGVPLDLTGMWEESPILYRFALPAAVSSFLYGFAQWLPQTFLVKHIDGFSEVAIFAAADQVRMVITFIPTIVASASLPILASAIGQKDFLLLSRTFLMNLAFNAGLGLGICVPVMVYGSTILGLYGHGFAAHGVVMRLMGIVGFFGALASVFGSTIASRDNMWWGALFNFIWASSVCVASAALAPKWGSEGIATAYAGAYVLHIMLQGLYLANRSNFA